MSRRRGMEPAEPDAPAPSQHGPNIPNLAPPDRDAAIKDVLAAVRKKCGPEAIMEMSEDLATRKHPFLPTGSLQFDKALGGGWACGRVIELFGPAGGGKTTMALQAIASVQALGGIAALVDAEHCFDPAYAAKIGCRVGELLVSQPSSGEEGFAIAHELVNSKVVSIVVVDSDAAFVPQAERERDITEDNKQMGILARLMSAEVPKLVIEAGKAGNCIVLFISQTRMNLSAYGNPEVSTGGNALKFYASARVDVRAAEKIKVGEDIIGHKLKLKVVKNKLAPPFREVLVDLIYGRGLWREAELVDLGAEKGVIEKSGAWYSYKGERLAQGRENTARRLEENREMFAEVEARIREGMFA